MDDRPDPDQLLKRVQADEESARRGRLKLFFGASPGVGKTYAMLEAARQRKKEGWDVVVGVVETHKRAETEALIEGLEVLPRKEISYKGVVLKEFDLDGALARRPRLLLVDELAHTNAEGSRHAKRWQDVEELLDAGIDVYTALNVQHWESLNDVVAQVTGVLIRETVPDTFLRKAHDLELVDLAPEDLLKRLKDGKVYRGETAGRAADNFFQPGNLIALRELALRHAAERVDDQMRAFKERHSIEEVWSVGDRLMVGVTAGPMSARLVRAASRLAARLKAPWIAVHVETRRAAAASPEERGRIAANVRLAESLGAETATLTGDDVTEEMLALARARNVTRILLGKPAQPRWKEYLFGSVVNRMARRCGNIDLHIISGLGADLSARRPPAAAPRAEEWTEWAWGALAVALVTLLCWPLSRRLDRVNIVMIYLAGVVWTAYRFGRRASFSAAVLGVLAFDFFFVPPVMTFAVSDAQYVLTFVIMLGVGLLIGSITGRLRHQTEALRRRESRMRALYKLSRSLSETPEVARMIETAAAQLRSFYGLPILILTADARGDLAVADGDPAAFGWNDNELSVARWVFDKSQPAGAGTDTLAGAAGLYLPLKGIRGTVGVLALRPADKAFADLDQFQLLETFAGEIGGALESTRMSEAMGRAEMQLELQAVAQSAAAGKPLKVADRLTEKRIVLLQEGLSKEQVIRSLLARLDLPNPTQAFQAVMEREKNGATLIGSGVAVPHARLEGLKSLQAALGVSARGPEKVWVLFVSPAEDTRSHLSFLGGVAGLFQKEGLAEGLCAAKSAADALDILRKNETPAPRSIAPSIERV